MSIREICTVGYERSALPDFLQTLSAAGVDVVVDARERPFSRRHEFSRDALHEALAGVGIGYRHERALGAPPAVRYAVKADGDYERFFRRYREHLDGQDEVLEWLAEELDGTVALLCYERDPAECHRSVVAERLVEMIGVDVRDLFVESPEERLQGDLGF